METSLIKDAPDFADLEDWLGVGGREKPLSRAQGHKMYEPNVLTCNNNLNCFIAINPVLLLKKIMGQK